MKLGIQSRLFFAFVGTIALVVVAMALAVNWSFQHGLVDYLRQVELERLDKLVSTLSQSYGEQGDWEFLRHNFRAWGGILEQGLGLPQKPVPRADPGRGFPPEGRPFPRHRPPPGHRFSPEGRLQGPPEPGAHPPPPGAPGGPPPGPLDLRFRLRLLNAEGAVVFGRPGEIRNESRLPIQWQGETVGFLALTPGDFVTDELAQAF